MDCYGQVFGFICFFVLWSRFNRRWSESHSEPMIMNLLGQNRGDDEWEGCWLWSFVISLRSIVIPFIPLGGAFVQRRNWNSVWIMIRCITKQLNLRDQAIAKDWVVLSFQISRSILAGYRFRNTWMPVTLQLNHYGVFLGDWCGSGANGALKPWKRFIAKDFLFLSRISTWMIWSARDYIFDLCIFWYNRGFGLRREIRGSGGGFETCTILQSSEIILWGWWISNTRKSMGEISQALFTWGLMNAAFPDWKENW